MRRKECLFSDSLGENRGRVNDLVQLGDQAAGANKVNSRRRFPVLFSSRQERAAPDLTLPQWQCVAKIVTSMRPTYRNPARVPISSDKLSLKDLLTLVHAIQKSGPGVRRCNAA
jgi:hypothetical protein